MAPVLSILMPVYDEAPTVARAVEAVLEADLGVSREVVIVDDGSTDGTAGVLAERDWPEEVRILTHDRNRGKGAAIRSARDVAEGEICCIFDADLEYDPADLAALIAPILEGETRAAFGVRVFEGHTSHSFLYVLGNRFVTLVANVLFNVYLRDLMTCHKALSADLFRSLPLEADGFEIEPELAARVLQQGERIYEVPVSYRARTTEEGKKLTSLDGLRVVMTLFRCRFAR